MSVLRNPKKPKATGKPKAPKKPTRPVKPAAPLPAVIQRIRAQMERGETFNAGWCLREVREAYQIPAYYGSATDAWMGAAKRHRVTDPSAFPARAVPVFWLGGGAGHGHVAVVDPVDPAYCYTTDLPKSGRWGRVLIADVSRLWPNLRLVGWCEDLNRQAIV